MLTFHIRPVLRCALTPREQVLSKIDGQRSGWFYLASNCASCKIARHGSPGRICKLSRGLSATWIASCCLAALHLSDAQPPVCKGPPLHKLGWSPPPDASWTSGAIAAGDVDSRRV